MITFEPTPFSAIPKADWVSLADARAVPIDPGMKEAFVANGPAVGNVQRLLDGALCVTTGQQPGLFTGPLFTLYKALTASAFARSLEGIVHRPVIPVFWVAGDDHDFAEANHCYVLDAQGELAELELRRRDPNSALVPLYKEPLGPEIEPALERLDAALPESEFRASARDWLRRHYQPSANFASAFAGGLAELLGSQGVVVFQPSHPAAKRRMAPVLARALTDARALDHALSKRAKALVAAGREAPVTVGDGATLVMIEARLGRDRLVLNDGRYTTRRTGETWEPAVLSGLLDREPDRFSANVLLRPVVEAAILPTLAYVGGPGELAYLEQADPLYERLGVHPQARLPRWSGRALEPRVLRALEKYHVSADVLIREGARLEAELLREEIPPRAREAFQSLRQGIQTHYSTILAAATQVDPTLQKTVESARNAALAGVQDVEKRVVAHLKKRNDVATAQLTRARTSLAPQGRPQERVLGVVSFLARYGTPFIDQAMGAVAAWAESLEPAHRGS
ncbi:MAG: bacillithiol biosynthesis cysteine-adding enzyme BshC [Gemmatimonadetes bacterium]|nr:bacillithiol biosynthesis cysteine-adding enzyme BshC [Gemmatimonadota bacterium]